MGVANVQQLPVIFERKQVLHYNDHTRQCYCSSTSIEEAQSSLFLYYYKYDKNSRVYARSNAELLLYAAMVNTQ